MKKFTADYIFTLEGDPIKNGIVVTDDDGKILGVAEKSNFSDQSIEHHKGVIVPGFINTHCHLELSHLLGKIPKGDGLVSFIKEVLKYKETDEEAILSAMKAADNDMWNNGIVAVGDISNNALSVSVKKKSPIKYHTFVEMVGFDPAKADETLAKAIELKEVFNGSSSIAPHAPYTVSKQLMKKLYNYSKHVDNLITIHNQESPEEGKFYRYKIGDFSKLYEDLQINIDFFTAQSRNTIQTIVPLLPENQRTLLVHNTFTSLKDVYFIKRFTKQIFWCFCPNANLYIEKALPSFEFFKHSLSLATLGTDSLASNATLSILDEMKTIHQNQKNIPFSELLRWGTINGAKFLGLQNDFGSIKEGKRPGLNLITNFENDHLTANSAVKKLI